MKVGEIDLADVQAGDILIVQDAAKNVMQGDVTVDTGQLMVAAFETWLTVARVNRAGRMAALPGLRIVGHQTVLPLFDE